MPWVLGQLYSARWAALPVKQALNPIRNNWVTLKMFLSLSHPWAYFATLIIIATPRDCG